MVSIETPAAVQQPQPVQQANPTPGAGAGTPTPTVPGISDLLSTVGSLSSLSSAGKEYFNQIKVGLTAPEYKKVLPINFVTLTNPQDALAIECGGKVIIIIPEEVITDVNENYPLSIVYQTAMTSYNSRVGAAAHKLLQFIMVTPDDYSRVDVMIRGLLNIFQVQHDQRFSLFNISSMSQERFSISTNHDDVNRFMEHIYPHKAMPRNDFGFVLYRNLNNKDAISNQYTGIENTVTRSPFACVTGYVEPMQMTVAPHMGGGIKYIPVVHISSIQCLIPDLKVAAMLVPLAASVFLRGGLWRTQFEQFSKDKPNLGSLFRTGTTGQLDFIDNRNKMNETLDRFFEPAALVIDVVDGLYRIPGLEKMSVGSAYSDINQMFYKFINKTPSPEEAATPFTTNKYSEYVGTVMHRSTVADSRWCDYMNTAVHHASDIGQVSAMLQRSIDPKIRVEQIRRFYGSFRVLMTNVVCEVSLKAILSIQDEVQKHVNVVFGNLGQGQNTIDLGSFLSQGSVFAQSGGMNNGLWGNNTVMNYTNPHNIYTA